VLAQAVFTGNIYYWLSGGYFAQPAIFKPLLHTWSLAVEEQFYLFFPILFLPWWRLKMANLRWMIGLAALCSLALSVVLTKSAPDAGFYLLPSRAWELFGGALLAMTDGKPKVPRFIGEAIGWSGLLAIGLAFGCYDEKTPFPGLPAVLPCAGAAAIIWANDLGGPSLTLVRVLSLRPLVFTGRISYSLYLWHWPILVFAMYWQEYGLLRWFIRAALLGLSVVLAVASWKFIETPFRARRVFPQRRAILAFGLLAPMACVLLGVVLNSSHGMPSRFTDAVVACDAARTSEKMPLSNKSRVEILRSARQGNFLHLGPADRPVQCLLWGDSHAFAVSPALAEAGTEFPFAVEIATYSATCPILDYESLGRDSLGQDAKQWGESILEHICLQHISNVVLVAHWGMYWESANSVKGTQSRREFADKLKATTLALQGAGARVWIMKDVPYQPVDVPKAIAKSMLRGSSFDIGVTKEAYMTSSRLEDEELAPAASSGAIILDPTPSFFFDRKTSLLMCSGYPLYSDHEHLTRRGALLLVDLFRPIWAR
jgi:hypothetical protein